MATRRSWLAATLRFTSIISLSLLLLTGCAARTGRAATVFPPLLDATLDELRAGLDSGDFTSADLVTAYLARIGEVNGQLSAVTEINPDALALAAEADAQRRRSDGAAAAASLGPLHGIPVLLKDNIATRDLMNNTAGSYALLGARVPEDSTVVARLRRAGAVILGKANMSQWAACRSHNVSQGWSAYGGQTVGAYYPGHDPSGSSSGSAVASSLGLAWASLGTETAGSISHPAHKNNLVGIKPTVGLTSRYLVVPVSEHQDTVGPLARTVKDAAYLLAAIVGGDDHDNYTSAIPFDRMPDYVAACRESGLQGKRLGVTRELMELFKDPSAEAGMEAFEAALDILRDAGAEVIDNIPIPSVNHLRNHSYEVVGPDFYDDVGRYFALLETNPHDITTLEQLRNFTVSHPKEGYPDRDIDTWEHILKAGTHNDSPEFWRNYTAQLHLAGPLGLTGALRNHSLDAVVLPAPWAYVPGAALGTPVVTVPLGRSGAGAPARLNGARTLNETGPNQPFGIGFAGAAWSEELLVGMAYAFERRTMVRVKVEPMVRPVTELGDVVAARRRGGGEETEEEDEEWKDL